MDKLKDELRRLTDERPLARLVAQVAQGVRSGRGAPVAAALVYSTLAARPLAVLASAAAVAAVRHPG